jgi:hypothetical protein
MVKEAPKKKTEKPEKDEVDEVQDADEEGPDKGKGTTNKLLRQAYGTATQQLREQHRDEFEDLYTAAAKELGVNRTPRLTPEQKAEQEFDELLAEFPHLRDRLTQQDLDEEQEGLEDGPAEEEGTPQPTA